MKIKTLFGALLLMFAASANAEHINLFEACVNIDSDTTDGVDGEIYDAGGPICSEGNFAPPPDSSDTIGDVNDGLGMVRITISDAGNYFVGMFVDWDLNDTVNTFFDEAGLMSGAAAAGQSWEIDEPGFFPPLGDIFENFLAGAFDNSNESPGPADISLGLGWDFVLDAGQTAVVTFLLSLDPCAAGVLCLSQSDRGFEDEAEGFTVYFSSTLDIRDAPVDGVPEPGTLFLLGAGLLGLGLRRRMVQKH